MTSFDRAVRRAANIAANAEVSDAYSKLPNATRDRIVDDFRREKANGGTVGWARYIEVILPLLPATARQ